MRHAKPAHRSHRPIGVFALCPCRQSGSIELEPDNSAAPFLLKPLLTNPISNATGPSNLQTMVNQASKVNPKGTVTIVR